MRVEARRGRWTSRTPVARDVTGSVRAMKQRPIAPADLQMPDYVEGGSGTATSYWSTASPSR